MDESITRFRLHCDTCLDEEIFSLSASQYDHDFHQDGRPKASLTVLTRGWTMESPAGSTAILYFCPTCLKEPHDETDEAAGRAAELSQPAGPALPGPLPKL